MRKRILVVGHEYFLLNLDSHGQSLVSHIGITYFKIYSPTYMHENTDVYPWNGSTVNESPNPARLGRGLHHEMHPSHTRADHPQALAERFCEAVNG